MHKHEGRCHRGQRYGDLLELEPEAVVGHHNIRNCLLRACVVHALNLWAISSPQPLSTKSVKQGLSQEHHVGPHELRVIY